jgi:3',5'-cyclic-nucleotide phosphodiesterase
MEKDLGIPSALFAPPVREIVELGKSQIGFMNMFAIPLFQGVTNIMPAMQFCVDELHRNKIAWEEEIAEEQARRRQNSDDSGMMDGMFSPRTMSVATPSDASHQKIGSATSLSPDMDLRKALLTKSPFSPKNGILEESSEPHHHSSLPEISTGSIAAAPAEESAHPSPNESVADAGSRRSSKPSQLQLSYATASAPGLADHPSHDPEAKPLSNGEAETNGITIEPSLVTDPVIVDQPAQETAKTHTSEKQRSSDTTESSNSAGDWTSQATSATTSKMPLSPSTQGTSITSAESDDKPTPKGQSLLGSPNHSQASTSESVGEDGPAEGRAHPEGKGIVVMEKVRNLKKKPSRFRMNSLNFWKRSKSSSPPVPPVGRHQSEDEAR